MVNAEACLAWTGCGGIISHRCLPVARAQAGRYEGITLGVELQPGPGGLPLPQGGKDASSAEDVAEWLKAHSSWAISYTPQDGMAGGVAGKTPQSQTLQMAFGPM